MKFIEKILGDPNAKVLSSLQLQVDKINALEKDFEGLSDDALRGKTDDLKKRLSKGEKRDAILPEAFATVREAAKRTIGQRHYDVQLIAGLVLDRGEIAEMKTGEGKTLAATLPLYLNALESKGAHLVTVNDYLARLHASWMGQVYAALGMSTSCIQQQNESYLYDPGVKKEEESDTSPQPSPSKGEGGVAQVKVDQENLGAVTRKEAYQADITYGTNNEFGFDYLRDNMAPTLAEKTQRGLHYAIVDEVDSILIDEARTPLIISAPAQTSSDKYYKFAELVTKLSEGEDYNIDEKMRAATLTDGGIKKMEEALGVSNIYTEGGIGEVHHIESALRAHALFQKDKDYVVKDGEVIIVDEFTGRLMYGRRYSEGLHQAIEAKEGVDIQRESVTMATITFQNLFRLYNKLSGMTGTAKTEEEEFAKIYGLSVVVVPTNRPTIRQDRQDRIFKNETGKFAAIVKEIKEKNEIGQPILVGTISIEKNEYLAGLLTQAGVTYQMLNAKNHAKEAETIAQAGRPGAVTIATNMAGRGVDIILGGNPPDNEEAQAVKHLGGLYVIGTERHESRRIDNQLRGRAGRQGDQGASVFFVSLEDDLMRIFGSDKVKGIMERLGMPDDMPIENKMITRSIESAQKKVEGHNFDARKHLVEYDDVINKHREVIYNKRNKILTIYAKLKEVQADTKNNKPAQNLAEIILEYVEKELETVVSFHTASDQEQQWNLDEIYETADTIFPVPLDVRLKIDDLRDEGGDQARDAAAREKIISYLVDLAEKEYTQLTARIVDMTRQNMGDTHTTHAMLEIEKLILVRSIDTLWVEHIDAMDHLRRGIGLRGYGQRDPLVEYKKEAYRMFVELQNNIQKQVTYSIYKVGLAPPVGLDKKDEISGMRFSGAKKTMEKGMSGLSASSSTLPQGTSAASTTLKAPSGAKQAPVAGKPKTAEGKKIGRNDPCPCGAINPETKKSYKFKKCGMINAPHHKG